MLLALVLAAAPALPDCFKLPPKTTFAAQLIEERYGQASTHIDGPDAEKRGHHWSTAAVIHDATGKEVPMVWAAIKRSLVAAGWTVNFEALPTYANARYQKGGKDVWAIFAMFGWDDIRIELIEVQPYKSQFSLPPPGAKVEPIVAGKDYPWLLSPPGSTFQQDVDSDGEFWIHEPNVEEPTLIAAQTTRKDYAMQGISNLELVTMYRDALTKAGWRIQSESQSISQSDVVLTAQYAKNGRNVWVSLHGGGPTLALKVADVGAFDLARALEKDCHVALSGVNFDFNQATLKPESTPVLEKVVAVLKANAKLVVEVQGHTDNVGGDAFNLKLSEARAGAVMKWLVAHQVDGKRLAAKGYGRAQPVADNESQEGRAKNRRVELRRRDCK